MIKFAVKDLNSPLLMEELEAVGIERFGLLFAGFPSAGAGEKYTPFASRQAIGTRTPAPEEDLTGKVVNARGEVVDEADPGELRFRFDPALTARQESDLDVVLGAHDATMLSRPEINRAGDRDTLALLTSNYRGWSSLDTQQKDENRRQITRLVARLLDKTTDL